MGELEDDAGDSQLLSEAIVIWIGLGTSNYPDRSEDRLRRHFGRKQGRELATIVRALAADYTSSEAKWTAPDTKTALEQATAEFRSRYPEISSDAIKALEWCLAFEMR